MLGIILISIACSNDDNFVDKIPTSEDAAFSFTFDEENPNKILFKAAPGMETWYTHWDFGDGSSAEGLEAGKVYLKKGDYDVRLKIFTKGGTAESIQTIVINEDFKGPNILQNGEFNDDESWTILPIGSNDVSVSLDNGNAHWTGGNWGHTGIYQPVEILANNLYQISMDIKGGPLSDSWFEVYVGKVVPEPGTDYNDGGIRLGLNTWAGCGREPFEGNFAEISCVGTGTFKFPTAGTVYLVIRGGGGNYGANGVTIDNVAIRSLE